MIITRGFGIGGRIVNIVNFIKEAIGHLEKEDNLFGALEEGADFVGILQKEPDEYVGHLDGEDVVEGGLGDDE